MNTSLLTSIKTLLLLVLSLTFLTGWSQETIKEETHFSLYGFGRTTFVWDDQNLKRSDLFVPANIEIGEPKNPNFFIGAKQTRLGMDVKQTLGDNVLTIKLEGDFHNDASDATGLFRLRHAFANYRFALVGMTWSNFFEEAVNPTTVDFEGPNSSTLSRTPQIRFSTYKTKNVLSLSFENPIENISVGGTVTVLPERFPDIIGAYKVNSSVGFVKAAALVRELRYESDKARSLVGYGVTVMAALKVGENDKVKFQGVMGTGVAKYIQGASGLNYDAVYNGTNELEALQMQGGNFSYQHFWKDHVHTSITFGVLNVEDNSNLADTDYQSGYYGSANLFWDVIKNLTFGGEIIIGERVNMNQDTGAAARVQMNATYTFNKSFN